MTQNPKAQTGDKLIHGVPTNIITGFLGVGKTSTILHLLKNKPSNERWAVLVNEFGEIGIDGSIIEGLFPNVAKPEAEGVFIREVPGGCMCCTAGLPMRVALTQLIRQAKPDRLLIEPTGLGHPQEVLQTLNEASFQNVLTIHKTLTLVDARQLSDKRYAEHDVFQQQIDIADVIIANKEDLYSLGDKTALTEYLLARAANADVIFTQQGVISADILNGDISELERWDNQKHEHSHSHSHGHSHNHTHTDVSLEDTIPESGFIKALNNGEGFVSVGWRFAPSFEFDQTKLFILLSGMNAERVKATFITNKGHVAYNITKDALTEVALDSLYESRIEIIAKELDKSWEEGLFSCAIRKD